MKSKMIAEDKARKAHPLIETIKARVEERVTAANLSRNEASRRARLGLSYVNDLLADKSRNPTREALAKLAKVLDTDVAYFFGEQDVPRMGVFPASGTANQVNGHGQIPLYQIGLTDLDGFFALLDSSRVPWTSPITNSPGSYCVTVPDDTMAPRFRIGEVVVVNPSKPVLHGGFAVVRLTDKRVAIREVVTIAPDKVSVRTLGDQTVTDIPREKVERLDRIVATCELV
ncbi:LexA family transcriptional regulator [Rhodopseudomonas palustris]|uniref:LexA family transcriptional regulator n=1 Tax=Rhodopseudomonas palustris TaxID=1076 RepID=UPI001F3CA4D4|nr:LexA family transcriptional regulator [Rhodopseudomonas palustris]